MSDFKPYGARSFTSAGVVFIDANGAFIEDAANFSYNSTTKVITGNGSGLTGVAYAASLKIYQQLNFGGF